MFSFPFSFRMCLGLLSGSPALGPPLQLPVGNYLTELSVIERNMLKDLSNTHICNMRVCITYFEAIWRTKFRIIRALYFVETLIIIY